MKIESLESIHKTAKEFIAAMGDHKVFLFYGSMGAGKTTFIRAICEELGVKESINSPTFAIINEYAAGNGDPIFHFDFYRITKPSEALDIGLYDYLDSGCLCLMEWPENVEDLLPEETLKVFITVEPDLSRTISWED